MKTLSLILLLAGTSPINAAEEPTTGGVTDFKGHYKQAFDYFTQGNYSRAIQEWNAVLKIDADQKTAQKMVRTAREKIQTRDKKELDRLFAFIAQGDYQAAFLELQPLLDRDPTHPFYHTLQTRLELLTEIIKKTPRTRSWQAAKRGLRGYIAREDNLRLAFNGLRHAQDINPKEMRFKRILSLLIKEDPRLSEEKITPGMKLLEYKQFVALNNIYDGKYDLAVENLNEVLALEPADLTSLKRLGSAYYSLKRYARAEKVWLRALKLSPRDKQLRRFLTRAKRARFAHEPKKRR